MVNPQITKSPYLYGVTFGDIPSRSRNVNSKWSSSRRSFECCLILKAKTKKFTILLQLKNFRTFYFLGKVKFLHWKTNFAPCLLYFWFKKSWDGGGANDVLDSIWSFFFDFDEWHHSGSDTWLRYFRRSANQRTKK